MYLGMMEALELEGMIDDFREAVAGAILIRGNGLIGSWLSAIETREGPAFELRAACERTLSVVLRSMVRANAESEDKREEVDGDWRSRIPRRRRGPSSNGAWTVAEPPLLPAWVATAEKPAAGK